MHILANMRSKICIKRLAHWQLKVCHCLGGDKGGGFKASGDKWDKGEGGSR